MATKKGTKRKTTKKSKSSSKPIGYVKEGKGYKLVFGTKSKPKLGRTSFKTKSNALKKAKSLLK